VTFDPSIEARAARLKQARARRYRNGTTAARAFGWPESTYLGHENGSRALRPSTAERYARAYGVSLSWLLTGEAEAPAILAGVLDTSGREALAASLKAELAKPGRSQAALARRLSLDSTAINRACTGERELSALELRAAEAYLSETAEPSASEGRPGLNAITLHALHEPTAQAVEAGAAMYLECRRLNRTAEVAAWHIWRSMIEAMAQGPAG
jgi:hypothetical protein